MHKTHFISAIFADYLSFDSNNFHLILDANFLTASYNKKNCIIYYSQYI